MFIINIYNQTYNVVAESRGQVRFYFLDDVGMAHPVTIRYGL